MTSCVGISLLVCRALPSVAGEGGVVPSFCVLFLHPVDPVTGARASYSAWAVRRPRPKRALSLPLSLSPPQLEQTRAVHVTSHPTEQAVDSGGAWPARGLNSRSLFMRHTHPRARLHGELGVFKSGTNILTFPDMSMLYYSYMLHTCTLYFTAPPNEL